MSTNVVAGDFLTAEFDRRLAEKQSAITALEAKERALTLTVAELQGRIDELKPELGRREAFDALVQRARRFADS